MPNVGLSSDSKDFSSVDLGRSATHGTRSGSMKEFITDDVC